MDENLFLIFQSLHYGDIFYYVRFFYFHDCSMQNTILDCNAQIKEDIEDNV
jgi:predicted DNA-binding protein YlxM (UPF0122 family)